MGTKKKIWGRYNVILFKVSRTSNLWQISRTADSWLTGGPGWKLFRVTSLLRSCPRRPLFTTWPNEFDALAGFFTAWLPRQPNIRCSSWCSLADPAGARPLAKHTLPPSLRAWVCDSPCAQHPHHDRSQDGRCSESQRRPRSSCLEASPLASSTKSRWESKYPGGFNKTVSDCIKEPQWPTTGFYSGLFSRR